MIQEEFENLQPYVGLMRKIMIDSAASNVPISYRELIKKYNKIRGYSICNCSSGIYEGTCRLYKEYLAYGKEQQGDKPPTKKHKRKS